ncbi:zinc-dependent alcohol dehydrogenase family protein [Streptomyces sp. SID13031]|uniref:zinc-dependent alcohol dehydrogenase family protein n=1 Tax=Streptomyces sp. SID13031 TaxID=2706046 RepID=UPI0013CA332A|nr:zinc-dependent alcohol dehydrogenase family protein [Streptomyces sp. SID13031]NEA32044.1 zinc-dependent alcohol dehydrogenase family protein [Streptomyces sp. SID13031]
MAMTVRFQETGGPGVLRLDDLEPGDPGPGEVLLRIDAIGLNRADVLFRSGQYIEPVKQFPAGLGSEAAGVIEALGPGVTAFTVGQPVSVIPNFSQNDYPQYAERALAPVTALVPRPEPVDAVAGAAVWMPYLTAYGAMVEIGRGRAGDVVAINAASSSVGLAAIHTTNRLGATPIAITRTRAKRQRLLDEGAAEVIVSTEEDVAGRILSLTSGRGAEYVFDAVAGPGVVELARAVAADGTHFLWGAASGQPTPYPGFELGMPALNLRTYSVQEISRNPERLRRAIAFVSSGLRTGAFRPTVDRVFDLEDIIQAHEHLESNTHFGKIVVATSR